MKDWNEFSRHIRTNPAFVKPAFFNLSPENMIDFLEGNGLETVVERGDRAFPYSHRASDVLDTIVQAVLRMGVTLLTEREVEDIRQGFTVTCTNGEVYESPRLIVATGGLSYPFTGSSGDGYRWAEFFGHKLIPCFPSLTALVPKGYKVLDNNPTVLKGHIPRETTMHPAAMPLPADTPLFGVPFGFEGVLLFQLMMQSSPSCPC